MTSHRETKRLKKKERLLKSANLDVLLNEGGRDQDQNRGIKSRSATNVKKVNNLGCFRDKAVKSEQHGGIRSESSIINPTVK